MIRRRPIGSILWTSDSGSGSTEDVEFIRYIDGQDHQINEMMCLGSDGVTRKIHPKAQVEVAAGTVGQFTTNYLSGNGRILPIVGQLSINGSFQLLDIPNFVRKKVDCSLLKTCKLPLCPLVGGTPIHPIITIELSREDLTEMLQSPGVVSYLPVRIMRLGFRSNRALLHATSVMTSVVWGLAKLCGDAPQVTALLPIRVSIIVVMIGRVRLLNNFCCKYPLLVSIIFLFFPSQVWVAIFGLLAGFPFLLFAFAESDS